ncbi:SDR family NAD(P)-dependent oxidoreductase [Arthrobacter mangrovi]|uniref:Oxidoreductase n=1 Tax=Arthrobacter mangrovi TaxID=2966350 RepID=A0ABQ5MS21_9MICC|nr:SDR family NAD(P)-dependent oxidoreductase [Arthrobacter mangrovi]GLB66780.1 oxidoreductase [Arthrobacter mangrovi]
MTEEHNPADIQSLHGRTIVVTGGNAGLGYFASEQLAAAGAHVVIAARNPAKAAAAAAAITARIPEARISCQPLDLASLDSVRETVASLARLDRIDALLANAGVIGSPTRRDTADGFELQFGTNHLGHYALICGLLPELERRRARIVHVGSISHRWVRTDFRSAAHPERYSSYRQYALSKLAVMSFGFELARLLELSGSGVSSVVAHPGYARSMFTPSRPGVEGRPHPGRVQQLLARPLAQGKDDGARPLVRAVGGPDVCSEDYWGPDGFLQLTGRPARVRPRRHALERKCGVPPHRSFARPDRGPAPAIGGAAPAVLPGGPLPAHCRTRR